MTLTDKHGRVHDYLRISLTDKCNLRCVYCMPAEGMHFMENDKHLSFDEIEEVVRVAAKLGITRLRLTGGEPLVRPHVEDLVARLHAIPGIEDIALTTNAIFLAPKAELLKKAGITRLNISLDSMNPEKFAEITRGGHVHKVLEGLEAAFRVGFHPIKINTVLMKGFNDEEVDDFLRLSIERDVHVRFIEYMPIGHDGDEWRDRYLSLDYVLERCQALGLTPEPTQSVYGNGPAEYYRLPNARGTFGLIHPVSDHFCERCNRLRLTADGSLKPCLFWQDEFNVRPFIGDEQALIHLFHRSLDVKPESHEMANVLFEENLTHAATLRRMSQIGG
ncbi:GTP 3',8-cyclase MoaA [Tumebacillus permanentifrigoris]|uniref:GTP 3',8-cyclase n=1 Tax=Tumebacillus permanentifrigoris TaxID=378543 RepID=A0A316DDD5_9BACL|nr:GTP 3',8-cyclase MoaA [Tumebacillus permanentifrigoris]PWK15696.1 cyclic pyranopterin phosphate synthase [Tumebacillus permanentifrigoris]